MSETTLHSENSPSPSPQTITKTKNLFIHLTLVTELISKENVETKCICHNLITETHQEKTHSDPNTPQNLGNLPVFIETEVIPSLLVPIQSDGSILINDISSKLKSIGYPITGALLSIYNKKIEDYIFIGCEPIDNNLYIDPQDVDMECIKIKILNHIEDNLVKKTENELFEKKENFNIKEKNKRNKERNIGNIIEKVNTWRKMYNGFYNENGELTRYSLDRAAKLMKISKKSLDDYLLQMRLGRKYGFDFNLNKNNKVGVLRKFVKKKRGTKEL